jgi:glycine/D-amino acid oxidase-like deaminating enzyme
MEKDVAAHKHIPVIVIGGGQAGLAVSRQLAEAGIESIILETGHGLGTPGGEDGTPAQALQCGQGIPVFPEWRSPVIQTLILPRMRLQTISKSIPEIRPAGAFQHQGRSPRFPG